MWSSASLPLRLIAALCFVCAICGTVSADTIYLKNGRKITASNVVQENGQVSYETSAGRLSLPASIVDKVVHDTAPLESVGGTAADRAANLPIAPPNLSIPANNDENVRGAVRDGSGMFVTDPSSSLWLYLLALSWHGGVRNFGISDNKR